MKFQRTVSIAGTLGATCAATLFVSADASADDGSPCGGTWRHQTGYKVQTCPDWSPDGMIPVYASPSSNSGIVGKIKAAGDDWYICQLKSQSTHKLGRYQNNWWALTMADNNAVGWVAQTYFSGGDDFERDGKLRICDADSKNASTGTQNKPVSNPATPAKPAPNPAAPKPASSPWRDPDGSQLQNPAPKPASTPWREPDGSQLQNPAPPAPKPTTSPWRDPDGSQMQNPAR